MRFIYIADSDIFFIMNIEIKSSAEILYQHYPVSRYMGGCRKSLWLIYVPLAFVRTHRRGELALHTLDFFSWKGEDRRKEEVNDSEALVSPRGVYLSSRAVQTSQTVAAPGTWVFERFISSVCRRRLWSARSWLTSLQSELCVDTHTYIHTFTHSHSHTHKHTQTNKSWNCDRSRNVK